MRDKHALLGLAAVLLAACQGETGILVAVSGTSVDEINFQVAVESGGKYILDHGATGQRYFVKGRNLNAEPFELLLHKEDTAASALKVLVLALGIKDGKDQAFDITDPPQPFIEEEVVRCSLQLRELSSTNRLARAGEGCFRVWRIEGKEQRSWLLASSSEAQCGEEQPLQPLKKTCTVERTASALCHGAYQLQPPVTSSSCTWEIVSTAGYAVHFANGSTTVEVCDPWLKLEDGPQSGTLVLKFLGEGSSAAVTIRLELTTSNVETCTSNPVQCE